MSILLDGKTRVLVQGITGRVGQAQTKWMLEYGTNIVAGVTPGKGGEEVEGVPVYNSVAQAVAERGAEASVFFVPPAAVKDAALETIDAGMGLIVVVTEHVPVHDAMEIKARAADRSVRLLGPTSPGIITPGEAKMGIMPGNMFQPGRIGVISRSGTLAYEICVDLAAAGLGQSTAISIGGDAIIGSTYAELMPLFEVDPETKAIVVYSEPGGPMEAQLAAHVAETKSRLPIVAFMAGRFMDAMPGLRFGHAGTIVEGRQDTAAEKIRRLTEAGISVAEEIADIPKLVKQRLETVGKA